MLAANTQHLLIYIAFVFQVITCFPAGAQSKLAKKPTAPLKIEWQPIQNNYQGKQQALSQLTITNISNKALAANGWTIYFNRGGDFPQPSNNGLTVSFINGDLFQLKPNGDFKPLPAGKSIKYNLLVEGRINNFSEGPVGFYIVWDNNLSVAFPLEEKSITPGTDFLSMNGREVKVNWADPGTIFKKNAVITDINEEDLIPVFPTPRQYNKSPGVFVLNAQTKIFTDEAFSKEADYLSAELGKVLQKQPDIVGEGVEKGITLRKGETAEEGYLLNISSSGIVITAATGKGAFYAIQSIKMLLPPLSWKSKQAMINIPFADISDQPRFGFRSFMLDVARNFQPKEEIFKLLDLMSLYKLNVFHFHLTEDEGWRIEIPSLPELTSVGSRRGHVAPGGQDKLQPSFGSGGLSDHLPGSGYYSKNDFIQILKFANDRHIQVIPEIESPGHARAAIKSMEARYSRLLQEGKTPEANKYLLSDSKDTSVYSSAQGWKDNVMNVALPSVYAFMETVTDDLIAMYKEAGAPLTTIHFGGDEVPAGVWDGSPVYHAFKKNNPAIENSGDLWYYYYGRLNQILKARGLFMSGWEEMGMRKTSLDGNPYYIPNPDFADDHFQLHVWNNTIGSGNEDLAYRLANAGYKVILSNVSNQYLDLAYNNSYNEPGQSWGGYVDVDKPFYFIPFDFLKNVKEDGRGNPIELVNRTGKIRLTEYGKSNIVGIEGLLWSENNINAFRLEYMLLPKLLGMAERAWSKEPAWAIESDSSKEKQLYNEAWSQFVNIAGKRELPRLTFYNGGYNYRIPPPGMVNEQGRVMINHQFPGFVLKYTINGKDPSNTSLIYTQPVTTKGRLRVAAFDNTGRHGEVMELENK